MDTSNIYAPPEADLGDIKDTSPAHVFFTVSIQKLVLMSLLTVNFYSLYWVYKHWKLQKTNANQDCIPILRTIFQVFFTHALFSTVMETALIKKIEVKWDAFLWASYYVLLLIIALVVNRMDTTENVFVVYVLFGLIIPMTSIFPMIKVQRTANEINDDPKGLTNKEFSGLNWLFIVLGLCYWAILGVGLFELFIVEHL